MKDKLIEFARLHTEQELMALINSHKNETKTVSN
jgi:hypothetical protein